MKIMFNRIQQLELRLPPLAVMLVVASAMGLVTWLTPALTMAGLDWGGAAVLVLGGLICLAGGVQFRMHATTVNPMAPDKSSALVTDGVYRYTRNPMYLGFAVMLIGVGTILGNLPALVLVPAFIGYLTRFQIAPEERILSSKFGAPYRVYLERVPRWL